MQKKRKNVISIVSFVIYIFVITIVFGFLFLFWNEESGGAAMLWAILIVPMSILPLLCSIILAFIAVLLYLYDVIKRVEITKRRTIWCLLNLSQIAITVLGGILIVKFW